MDYFHLILYLLFLLLKKDFSRDLTLNDLNSCNGYNTRSNCLSGLPVGPICNPSSISINAVFNPSDTDYLYFYADIKTGLVYFAENYEDFLKLKNEFGW